MIPGHGVCWPTTARHVAWTADNQKYLDEHAKVSRLCHAFRPKTSALSREVPENRCVVTVVSRPWVGTWLHVRAGSDRQYWPCFDRMSKNAWARSGWLRSRGCPQCMRISSVDVLFRYVLLAFWAALEATSLGLCARTWAHQRISHTDLRHAALSAARLAPANFPRSSGPLHRPPGQVLPYSAHTVNPDSCSRGRVLYSDTAT